MRYSRQRNMILDIVRGTDSHPTAEWVYEQARLAMPSIGIATVYRDLNTLAANGIIRKISISGQMDRFDRDVTDHSHMQCECCGALVDLKPVNSEAYRELLDMAKMTFDISADDVKLGVTLLRGTCEKCRRAASHRS